MSAVVVGLNDSYLDSEEERSRVQQLDVVLLSCSTVTSGPRPTRDVFITNTSSGSQTFDQKPSSVFWETCPTDDDTCMCVSSTLSRDVTCRSIKSSHLLHMNLIIDIKLNTTILSNSFRLRACLPFPSSSLHALTTTGPPSLPRLYPNPKPQTH